MAREFSQHDASKENGGDLDWLTPDTIYQAFDEFVFNSETEILSEPIRDEMAWTEGGYRGLLVSAPGAGQVHPRPHYRYHRGGSSMSVELLTGLLFGALLLFLVLGLPLVFCLGGVAIVFLYFLRSPQCASFLIYCNLTSEATSFLLTAIPLFIFMANMLERSGVAEDLYAMMYRWIGRLRGGLAIGTVLISTVIAAMVGLSSAATVTMGIAALPSMLKRGYSKHIAIGAITAGGTLGILIPPSVIMITYAMMAQVSLGRLWVGGILPGLLLSLIFIVYIGVRCHFQPELGPSLPPEERASWREKLISLRAVILPIFLVVLVLGSILMGIATPTEAAAVGAGGSILCAAIYRRLSWQNFKEVNYRTLKLACMIIWILAAATSFRTVYALLEAVEFFKSMLLMVPFGRWGVIIVIQLILLVLGCFLDPWGIVMIAIPVFSPVVEALGFDLIWFGILFVVNMEMGYLTPPVGLNIFYMKGVAPEGITIGDIYRSVVPFVLLQGLALVLIMIFPQLVLWLPSLVFK
ncbi:C4-dicarboxylate TRAP transporter large permease protein DctM [subsurface metagenome]